MEPEPATKADFDHIVEHLDEFWGERDLSALHHPMFVHEFGDGALVIRDEHGAVAAYLFGFVVPRQRLGYVHLVAVRQDRRGQGLGRLLYARFARLARERGCHTLKAITTPGNAASIAFHRALGMEALEAADYAGIGRARTVFTADLADRQ
jgi:L-amino acid N-acyltransferase YncA